MSVIKNKLTFANRKELQAYIANANNYKPVRRKAYLAWCCKPSFGTKIVNKTENRVYITDRQQAWVISDTEGDQHVVSFGKLQDMYTLGDGKPITREALEHKEVNSIITWFQIKAKASQTADLFAVFIPAQYSFEVTTSWGEVYKGNRSGIAHGLGDFVMCSSMNGKPFIKEAWVVNGLAFGNMYNNQGWTDCLEQIARNSPPKPKTIIDVRANRPTKEDTSEMQKWSTNICRVITEIFGVFMTKANKEEIMCLAYSPEAVYAFAKLISGMREKYKCSKQDLIDASQLLKDCRTTIYTLLCEGLEEEGSHVDFAKNVRRLIKKDALFDVKWDTVEEPLGFAPIMVRTRLFDGPTPSKSKKVICIEDSFCLERQNFDCYNSVFELGKHTPELEQYLDVEYDSVLYLIVTYKGAKDGIHAQLKEYVKSSAQMLLKLITEESE